MDEKWLCGHADYPIRYRLTKDRSLLEGFMQNGEVRYWLSQLRARAESGNLGKIHGSHDYRMENILGKCSILGLSAECPEFMRNMGFILDFLRRQPEIPARAEAGFGRIYAYRDYETVLACFLPALGFQDEPAVRRIALKRIDLLERFCRQKRYDIYIDGSGLRGVKKEWQPFIVDPALYADGNIALPTMHDYILFAGMYEKLDAENRNKVETIAGWLFDDRYKKIIGRYGYFYAPGGAHPAKAVLFKPILPDCGRAAAGKNDLCGLLWACFVLSRFETARNSDWFRSATAYLEQYKTEEGRYVFPKCMISDKPDQYTVSGGHMNVGENKRSKNCAEILSTYWMGRIGKNIGSTARDFPAALPADCNPRPRMV